MVFMLTGYNSNGLPQAKSKSLLGPYLGGPMRVRPLLVAVLFSLFFASGASAQTAPFCDVTCAPDPGSPTYSPGTFAARPLSHNVRGQGNPLAARAEGGHRMAPTIAGSQSA